MVILRGRDEDLGLSNALFPMSQPDLKDGAEAGLFSVLQKSGILITVGAGGVGKTTTAASAGLLAARLGRKTLVMTIDPARRLAASLGLRGGLDHQQRAVPAEKLRAAGIEPNLLYAMMLDQKQTFDEVVRRSATDEESLQRVMKNKLYRELSTRLAGGQEYAAMEKLHELATAETYDLLLLDTPPTANALDFLDAPQKMIDLLDSPAVSFFIKSYHKAGRFSFKLLSAGASMVFRRLARFVGGEFLDDVAQYFADMQALLEGFRERAARVLSLLSRDDVGFLIVTSPDPRAIDEAMALFDRLTDTQMSPAGFVINRVHTRISRGLDGQGMDLSRVVAELRKLEIDEPLAMKLAPVLIISSEQTQVLAEADAEQVQRLRDHCGPHYNYIEVPLFGEDIYDMKGLTKLGQYLA